MHPVQRIRSSERDTHVKYPPRKQACWRERTPVAKTKDAPISEKSDGAAGVIDPAIAALDYEQAVRELEALVESIEQGDIGLEASLASYRRGEQLLRHCKALLDTAETTVREMSLGELEQGSTSPR